MTTYVAIMIYDADDDDDDDDDYYYYYYHRLNGSSSPVLTATCLSYGSFCDFLTFFSGTPGGQTPQPIFTQNGSNDVDSRIDVPFAVKMETF